MLRLPGDWMWDFWLADDGSQYHLFFLFATRTLQEEQRRHHRAAIGHAVSNDLRTWVRVSNAVAASDPPAFDDLATWTGSVVRGPDDRWWLFYTAATRVDDQIRQTIGAATSLDLNVWQKDPSSPLVTADDRWYERLGDGIWLEEAWRDPWVLADPHGHGWHMLITARADHGPAENRGVIGHARLPDLQRWECNRHSASPALDLTTSSARRSPPLRTAMSCCSAASNLNPRLHTVLLGPRGSGTCPSTHRPRRSTSPRPAR